MQAPHRRPRTITLTNTGAADAQITSVDTSAIAPFGTDAVQGARIAAGGNLVIRFTAPPVPSPASLDTITGSVVIHTDADPEPSGTRITLSEQPQGASLAFGSPTSGVCGPVDAKFGDFSGTPVPVLQQASPQAFCITNAGNVDAKVVVVATETGAAGDGGAVSDASIADPFAVSTAALTAPGATSAGPGTQQDTLTFQPVRPGVTSGSLALSVDSITPSLRRAANRAPAHRRDPQRLQQQPGHRHRPPGLPEHRLRLRSTRGAPGDDGQLDQPSLRVRR